MYNRHPGLHIQRTEFSLVLIGKSDEIAVPGPEGCRGVCPGGVVAGNAQEAHPSRVFGLNKRLQYSARPLYLLDIPAGSHIVNLPQIQALQAHDL